MAGAGLNEELLCSKCLNSFTDPVTLRCGHNFCRGCVDQVLDTQDGSGVYSCPKCAAEFQERTEPQEQITQHNVGEHSYSTSPHQEVTGILCTYCIHSPVPAVKSCLLCEASLCDNHLKVHSKSPEHVLTDPSTSLENRKCSVHKEPLKYYCPTDAICICVSCALAGEHRGHQVEMLDEASEKKKEKLRNVIHKRITKREKTEEKVQSLEECWKKAQEKASGEAERITALFTDIRRRLDDLEKRILSEISRQEEKLSLSLSDVIQKLEIKKNELSRNMRHIEELCNVTDPLTVLQGPDTGDLCDPEEGGGDEDTGDLCDPEEGGGDEDTWRNYKTYYVDGDVITRMVHAGLSNIMTYLHTIAPIRPKRKRSPSPSFQYPSSQGSTMSGTSYGVGNLIVRTGGNRGIYVEDPAEILLEVNTAANNLLISDDRKTVTWTNENQNRPETAERFQKYQVMSSTGFTSGRHYWDVEISGMGKVGMCYPSIDRRGHQSYIGSNARSWCLCREQEYNNQYSVIHDSEEIQLPHQISSDRVRISLDYEAGELSFYELCDPIRHLHTFTAIFTEPLHAVLYVMRGSMKI